MICISVVQMWDISYFKAIKELLHPSHFCQVFCHLITVVVIFFLHLFHYQLESTLIRSHRMLSSLASRRLVTSPSYYTMLFVAGKSSWIAYFRISPSGGDEHDTSPCSFESVGSIEVHHLMIR
jgi:dolichyl-phosphate-mannose--protein O-mannosyl transferase